jgi:hypothetical protein
MRGGIVLRPPAIHFGSCDENGAAAVILWLVKWSIAVRAVLN